MQKRLNELSFVIGLFFFIVSLVLIANGIFSVGNSKTLNLLTGLGFLVFGLCMIFIRSKKDNE